jgi:hypothetical protein
MRKNVGLLPAIALLGGLSGCVQDHPKPVPVAGCPVIGDGQFEAWLDAMPGPGTKGPMLNIAGKVDLPTPGYRLELIAGPADRAMPPSQRFRLVATAPGGMTAQVVTQTQVKYRAPAQYPAYRSLIILCGDRAVATIGDIPTVH